MSFTTGTVRPGHIRRAIKALNASTDLAWAAVQNADNLWEVTCDDLPLPNPVAWTSARSCYVFATRELAYYLAGMVVVYEN